MTRSLGDLIKDAINYEVRSRFADKYSASPDAKKGCQEVLDRIYAEINERELEFLTQKDLVSGNLKISLERK